MSSEASAAGGVSWVVAVPRLGKEDGDTGGDAAHRADTVAQRRHGDHERRDGDNERDADGDWSQATWRFSLASS